MSPYYGMVFSITMSFGMEQEPFLNSFDVQLRCSMEVCIILLEKHKHESNFLVAPLKSFAMRTNVKY